MLNKKSVGNIRKMILLDIFRKGKVEKKSEVEDVDKKPEAVAANDASGDDGVIDLT